MSSHGIEPNPRPQPQPDSDDDVDDDADDDENSRPLVERLVEQPGDRKTANVEMLVIEAELAHGGDDPGNYAKPITEEVGEMFFERLDNHDLDDIKPAWHYADGFVGGLD